MVVKIYGEGFPERKPATSEQVPTSAPSQQLSPINRKPPLVFPGVTIPSATVSDRIWKEKFDKYAHRKKNRKCASMLRGAMEEQIFWRIAYALETRHQDEQPDRVFSIRNDFSITSEYTLDDYLTRPTISDDIKEMVINGFYPQHRAFVDFRTLADFHRDTLMTWAEHAEKDVLNVIFLATIYRGEADDIVKLLEMGAGINCKNGAPSEDYRTPLRCAISRQDCTVLQQVIDLGANIFFEFDHLMEQAYKHGNLDIVKTLKDAREAQEKSAGLQSKSQTNSTDGWTALSATFAEFSRPKGRTGLQVTYQFDFDAETVNCIYEKENAISAPTIIPLYQMSNPALVQKAADTIEQSGYPRPDTERALNHSPGARKITSVNRNTPKR